MTEIFEIIQKNTGLILSDAHKNLVSLFVERRKKLLGRSTKEYIDILSSDSVEFTRLIDEAAVNETYLFREEQQFDFLKNKYVPLLKDKTVKVWSAACSTGEEAVSLYVLLSSMGKEPKVYGSDIDTAAMETFKKGCYGINSFRADGKKYIPLLNSYGKLADRKFELDPKHFEKISIQQCNLVNSKQYPFADQELDIIFVRNVFIYFDSATRTDIIRKMERCLKPGGIIFLSVNEIASVEAPGGGSLTKQHVDRVYFFRKAGGVPIPGTVLKGQMPKFSDSKELNTEPGKTIPGSSHVSRIERSQGASGENHGSVNPENSANTVDSMDPVAKIQQQCSAVLSKINARHHKEAKQLLDSIQFRPENEEFKWYFEGLLASEDGRISEAINYYTKSALFNSQFWPATFQLGLLQKKQGNTKEMKKSFQSCINALTNYMNLKKVCYNFIVESFNPSYFLKLCENYIKDS